MRRDAICLLASGLICIAVCLPVLTKYPAPGSDEPGFVDPAATLLREGHLGTWLYDGLVPAMDRYIYWQPPLYFVALAAWFGVFGVGLEQARLMSLASGVAIVLLVYLLARRWTDAWPAFGASALCTTCYWLTTRATFARMDTLCVALSLAAVLAYMRGARWLAGILAALAFLTHPLGVIPLATILLHQLLTRRPIRDMAVMILVFAAAGALWLGYALQNWDAFQLQMSLQFARKARAAPYWFQFWLARHHAVTLLVLGVMTAWLALERAIPNGAAVVIIGTGVAFAAATYAAEAGYFIYFIPMACVALALVVHRHRLASIALAAALMNETVILGYNIHRYGHRDYAALSDTVRTVIPPSASVFIGFADVSPYFSLAGRNPMRTATPLPLEDPLAHRRSAAEADYVVITHPDPYLREVNALVEGRTPLAVVDQGPGYRIAIFANKH